MPIERDPPGGLEAHQASLEFTDPSKIEAWEKAATTVGADPRYEYRLEELRPSAKNLDAFGRRVKRRRNDCTADKLEAYLNAKRLALGAKKAARRDFGDKLRSGEIIAFGSLDSKCPTERSRLDADLWDKLRARTRQAWDASRFSGDGHTFHNVRFHRHADLEVWWKGAPLEFAIRAITPLDWENYQAFWSPTNAPNNVSEADRQLWGADDRREFWWGLLRSFSEHGLELRLLSPPGDPKAKWTAVSLDVEEVLYEAEGVDLERSTVTLPEALPMMARVFVADRFGGAGTAGASADPALNSNLGRSLPSRDKLYSLVSEAIEKIPNPHSYFSEHGRKIAFSEQLAGQEPFSDRPYKASTIQRILYEVLKSTKPD